MPTIVHVTISLPTRIPIGSNHQPPNEKQYGDSPKGSSPKRDPPREPPFNLDVGSYGWPTPNLCMFIPPWYQPPIV